MCVWVRAEKEFSLLLTPKITVAPINSLTASRDATGPPLSPTAKSTLYNTIVYSDNIIE